MNVMMNKGGCAIVMNLTELAEFFMSYTLIAAKAVNQKPTEFMLAVQILAGAKGQLDIPPDQQRAYENFIKSHKLFLEIAKRMDAEMSLHILQNYKDETPK